MYAETIQPHADDLGRSQPASMNFSYSNAYDVSPMNDSIDLTSQAMTIPQNKDQGEGVAKKR